MNDLSGIVAEVLDEPEGQAFYESDDFGVLLDAHTSDPYAQQERAIRAGMEESFIFAVLDELMKVNSDSELASERALRAVQIAGKVVALNASRRAEVFLEHVCALSGAKFEPARVAARGFLSSRQ